jgi:hypothetical protein
MCRLYSELAVLSRAKVRWRKDRARAFTPALSHSLRWPTLSAARLLLDQVLRAEELPLVPQVLVELPDTAQAAQNALLVVP